jgi:hypothetical protein
MKTLKECITADVEEVFFQEEDFAETLTYTQGKITLTDVLGIRHSPRNAVNAKEGFGTASEGFDWEIRASYFGDIKPRPGDAIEHTVAEVTSVYEVVPVDDKTPAAELDVSRLVWKIHTKQVQ